MRTEADDYNVGNNRIKGWSVTDFLTVGSEGNAVVLQAKFDFIGYYTAQFSIDIPPGSASEAGDVRALADITWTVEGNPITRRVSIVNGLTVSGMGQSVNIQMYDFSAITLPASTARYKVSCSVAPGSRPTSGSNPNLIINTDQNIPIADRRGLSPQTIIVPGASNNFDIPQNVGINSAFLAVAPVDTQADLYAEFNDLVAGSFDGGMSLFADSFNRWIPVPPATTQLQVNVDATYTGPGGVAVTPIFGIEG